MTQKSTLGNFFINVCLVWFWSATLDTIFPDLNLFIHIFVTIFCSSVTWALYVAIVRPLCLMFKYRKMIAALIKDGKNVDEIILFLNKMSLLEIADPDSEYEIVEEKPKRFEEVELKVTFIDPDKPYGFYMGEPFYEKILVNNDEYVFTGTADMKNLESVVVEANSLILKSGLIYKRINA